MGATVHSLWCGPSPLGVQQLLTVRSFQAHGHPFVLWTYHPGLAVLSGVELRDAREVVPEHRVYPVRGLGHEGSLAFFSDPFQLTLLEGQGGWWTQMDVLCLRPLDAMADPYVFAPHYQAGVSAYLMKAPAGSPALRWMIDHHVWCWLRQPTDWHDSMALMGAGVRRFGLEGYVAPRQTLDDDRDWWRDDYFRPDGGEPPAGRLVHHWCDSVNTGRLQNVLPGSFLARALARHGLAATSAGSA